MFQNGFQFYPGAAQFPLIKGAVVAVAGEPVQLVNNQDIKQAVPGVLDHLLELGAVVGQGGAGFVGVSFYNDVTIAFAVLRARPHLCGNAFFPLVVAGKPGIDNCFQFRLTPFTVFLYPYWIFR
ncbi:MAG: hypothetical protein QM303_06375 [Bacillota bacterium]|nr:hypothetical protein [Bacillota bacterium]